MKSQKKSAFYLNIIIFAIFIAAIIIITVKYTPFIMNFISSPEKFRSMLLSYGSKSIMIYILFQILHVIIIFIPGEVIQIAGGYVYGTFKGFIYSVIGIEIGMILVFFLSRICGYKLIKMFISEKSFNKLSFLINSKNSEVTMFLLFLIPGMPKDALSYIAGVTPVKASRFFIIASIARVPGLIGSTYIGSNLHQKNYILVIVFLVIACALFIAGILTRDKIINKINERKKHL